MREYAQTCARIGQVECHIGTGQIAVFDRGTGMMSATVLSADKFLSFFPEFIYQFESLESALKNAINAKRSVIEKELR